MPAGATYEPIATTTLSSNSATVTFSSIPGTYTDLILTGLLTMTTAESPQIRFNGDTTTNYSRTEIYGTGAITVSNRSSNQTRFPIGFASAGGSATVPGFIKLHIFSYAGSTNKTVLSEAANDQNGSGDVTRLVGLWRNTAAITSLELNLGTGNFYKTGSTFTLYGIKAA